MRCEKGRVIWDCFVLRYPELHLEVNAATDSLLRRYFEESELLLRNTACAVVPCHDRKILYNLLIAWKTFDMQRGAGVVGPITSATQGSVSLGMQGFAGNGVPPPYNSNNYGAQYWEATAKYRSFLSANAPKKNGRGKGPGIPSGKARLFQVAWQ